MGDVPIYLERNAINLTLTFPDHEVVVVSDSTDSLSKLNKVGVETWLCSNPLASNTEIVDLSSHNSKFRDNFWLKTVLRFFALEEYMSQHPAESVLHLEGDVWISQSFPFAILEELVTGIAYPLKTVNQGIASTVYIADLNSLKVLNEFVKQSFKDDAFSTDVSVLGKFHHIFPEHFTNLPTALPEKSFLLEQTSPESSDILSENLESFRGLFDASSLGIYYTGIDPRNNWGFRELFVCLDHKINFSKCRLVMNNSLPSIDFQDSSYPVYSLHIHSKDLRFFNYSESLRRLGHISQLDQNKSRREFSLIETPYIFLKTLSISILLRLRKWIK